eukprot:TRINITY_DN56283_c0_g1_i1.p2 TRINITY_DN56283_c0_g1~~TRINITY_DN56283_c0_g1_i1.p2  ORF type:complete len:104 (+),score=5.52 TRINITY_DN56283_c0_g1_i1:127-438(+)
MQRRMSANILSQRLINTRLVGWHLRGLMSQRRVHEERNLKNPALRRMPEVEHGATAADNAMERWLLSLGQARPLMPLQRPASVPQLWRRSVSALSVHELLDAV